MTTPRLLGERYELGETLGYGGMAEVHRGRDTRLGRDVAIKVLRQDLARDNGFQARFEREAQNSASLNHPAIVAVYDTGEEEASDGTRLPYIVMEYVEGRTLRDILADGGRLLPQRALEIVADVCSALEFSHRNGIIHRDIKPGNVMLTPSGQVKVMDFGIARALTQTSATMTQTSAVMGTAQYLSPEQARGEAVDPRSDVYSAGCLLYELLVGQPPFTGDSPVSVAYQHVREDPVPPSEHNPDVTPSMDAVVCKALAKNPANRYQSAGDMRADVLRAAAGRTVEATPLLPSSDRTQAMSAVPAAESTQMLRQPERRRRRIWPWVLLVLGLIAVGIAATFAAMALVGPKTASVPSVVGKTQAAATTLLQNSGFHVAVKPVHGADQNKGKVIKQKPGANASLTVGHTVTITVDQGVARIAVPSVRGLPLHQAQARLKAAGLKSQARTVNNKATAGTVVDSQPNQGTLAPANSPVTLFVSNGTVAVPSVTGLSRSAAVAKLQRAGLAADPAFVETDAASPGIVFAQNPDGGRLQPGSTVTISVAVAPPPPSPTPSPTPPSPSPTPTPTPSPSGTPSPSPSGSPTPTPSPSETGEGGGGGGGHGHHGGGGKGGGNGNGGGSGDGGGAGGKGH